MLRMKIGQGRFVLLTFAAVVAMVLTSLIGGASTANAASGCVASTYRQGAVSSCVKNIQVIINSYRNLNNTIATDGRFGPATKSAVVSFQRSVGITADGIVGPNTWKNLCSVRKSWAEASQRASGCDSIRGWTRIKTHTEMNIAACNAGTYSKLRFQLGSSGHLHTTAYIGSTGINVNLPKMSVSSIEWRDGTYSVNVNSLNPGAGIWQNIGSVTIKRSAYPPCSF